MSFRSRYLNAVGGAVAAAIYRVQTISAAGAVILDWDAYDEIRLTLTGDITLSMSGGYNGKKAMLRLAQNAVGGYKVTLPPSVRYNTDVPEYTATPTANLFDRLGFLCDANDAAYDLVAVAKGYLPPVFSAPALIDSNRYWRIFITSNNGDAYTSLQQVELRTAAGGPTVCPLAPATSQSDFYTSTRGNNDASRLCTRNYTDFEAVAWVSAENVPAPHWIYIDLGTSTKIVEVALFCQNFSGGSARAPKDFLIQSSSDAVTWRTHKTVAGATNWIPGTGKVFAVQPAVNAVTDPYFSSVVFLANFDTDFTDAKGKTLTVTGNPVINNVVPFAGGKSAKFDGSPARLSIPASNDLHFATAFTVEGWYYLESPYASIVDFDGAANFNYQALSVYSDTALANHVFVSNGAFPFIVDGGNGTGGAGAGTVTLGAWNHYAVCWDGSVYRVFINGILGQTVASSVKMYDIQYGVTWGAYYSGGYGLNPFAVLKGALGPQRITNGVSRYASNFTPVQELFPKA